MSSDDGPGALLMYENAEGRRVVLYACRNDEQPRDTAFRFAEEDAVSVFYWFEGPLSYALAGDLDRPALRALTESAYRQITI
jgi:anti-sigma factor RsiW